MSKSKLKWRVIWVAYCIPGILLSVPILLLTYTLMPFGWLSDRIIVFKRYLVRKYKP